MATHKMSLAEFKEISGLENLTDEQAKQIKDNLTTIIYFVLNKVVNNAKY